jgi:diacylglycerol kinase (ATP)
MADLSDPPRTAGTPPTTTPNPHKGRTGLARVVRAAGYSASGLHTAVRHESAFRQEAVLAAVLLPLSFWVGRSWVEVALLAGSVLLVMIVELLNSAIEATVDRVSMDLHELSKRAKDYGSAAVMLALLFAGGVWLAALWHRVAA